MFVNILAALLLFVFLLWLTKKSLIQYRIIHLKGSSNDRLNNITILRRILGKPIKIFDAHGPEFHPNFNTPGLFGNYKSHVKILDSVSDSPGYTVVLEDDVIFSEDFHSKILKIIDMDIEFDIIYLGNLDRNHGKHVSGNVFQVDPDRLMTGQHAYLVNNKNAKRITKHLQYKTNIDLEIPELIKSGEINGLVVYPCMAFQQVRRLPSIAQRPTP